MIAIPGRRMKFALSETKAYVKLFKRHYTSLYQLVLACTVRTEPGTGLGGNVIRWIVAVLRRPGPLTVTGPRALAPKRRKKPILPLMAATVA
jgi:hypothetical protein